MIPTVEPCRFMTIAQIRQKVADDSFQYNSVRVVGKVTSITPQAHKLVLEDPNDATQNIIVEVFLLRTRQIEKGKIYEFLGEIEQVKNSTTEEMLGATNKNAQEPNLEEGQNSQAA